MTEILTESFCERCGTRYTFQSAVPGRRRMKRLKVLSKGLKNYVLSDETTLEEAFADARGDEERAISSGQLDAFHRTFNFCMSCRQYTCENCWNGPENLCLTCSPDLSQEILPAPFPDLEPMVGVSTVEVASAPPVNEDRAALLAASAWPEADLPHEATPAPVAETVPAHLETAEQAVVADAVVVEAVADEPEAAAEAVVAEPLAVEAEAEPAATPIEAAVVETMAAGSMAAVTDEAVLAEPVATVGAEPAAPSVATTAPRQPEAPDQRAAAAAAQTAALLARFRPDRSLDQALAAYEQEADEAAEAEAAEAEAAEAAASLEPGLAAPAALEPEAEPLTEALEPEPAAPAGEVAAAAAASERRDDRVEIPTWRIVAPDAAPTEPAATPPVAPPSTMPAPPATPSATLWPPAASAAGTDGSAPQWPSAPFLAAAPPVVRARDAMWAASSLEVVEKAGGGVQSCVSCGLPLSATARFCRRCGSRQG